jgi:hypothetical protein
VQRLIERDLIQRGLIERGLIERGLTGRDGTRPADLVFVPTSAC